MKLELSDLMQAINEAKADICALIRLTQSTLDNLTQRSITMSAELDALTAEVTRNTEVDQSAITLINGLAAKIESLKTDPVALQALADSMRASSDSLAAAVVANTPTA